MQQQQTTEAEISHRVEGVKIAEYGLPKTELKSAKSAPTLQMPFASHLDRLLRSLNSSDSALRASALRETTQLINEPQALLQLAQREALLYRKRTVLGATLSLSVVGLAITNALFCDSDYAWPLVSVLATTFAVWLSLYIPRRGRRSLIGVFEQLDDPRFLGSALTMLVPDGITEVKSALTRDRLVRSSITTALKNMLPRVRADHAASITRDQMQTLLILMTRQYDLKLTVAILRALQQIGNESAMPAVSALAKSRYEAIRQTAQETLEFLNLRASQKIQAQTLLRASESATAARPEQMLRPANPVADSPMEQLLRPS